MTFPQRRSGLMIEQGFFEMQMKSLAHSLGTDIPKERAIQYYNKFKNYDAEKFAKIITYLKENYEIHFSFPLISDFINAYRYLFQPYNYMPPKREPESADIPSFMKRVLWCYKIMDEIKKSLVFDMINPWTGKKFGNEWNEYPKQTNPIVRQLYRDMASKGMVYSVETKRWVSKNNALGSGEYWDPAEWGKW
jgi:hypothetical protein